MGAVAGVMDGHGGRLAAKISAQKLPKHMKVALKGRTARDGAGPGKLRKAFVACDQELRAEMATVSEPSGTTAATGGLKLDQATGKFTVFVANAGDSRGIIVRFRREGDSPDCPPGSVVTNATATNMIETSPKEMVFHDLPGGVNTLTCDYLASDDHKPGRDDEAARIEAAGGFVGNKGSDCPRLDGNLAVSRGLGDFQYKASDELPPEEQKVSCIPELYQLHDCCPGSLLILACDGIFDVMSNEQLVEKVVFALAKYEAEWEDAGKKLDYRPNFDQLGRTAGRTEKDGVAPPQAGPLERDQVLSLVAEEIVRESLTLDSKDNMTICIIQMGHPETLAYRSLKQFAATGSSVAEEFAVGTNKPKFLPVADRHHITMGAKLMADKLHSVESRTLKAYRKFCEQCVESHGEVEISAGLREYLDLPLTKSLPNTNTTTITTSQEQLGKETAAAAAAAAAAVEGPSTGGPTNKGKGKNKGDSSPKREKKKR